MKFSTLLSLYYKESPLFLNACFKSIWNDQSIKPSEIVLVLDGSIGAELQQVILSWQTTLGDVLKVIPLPKNVGLGNALNEGLKHCSYDWVFRMDTDDICMPDRFEKQIKFIQQNPDVVLVGGQVFEFNQHIGDSNVLKAVPVSFHDIQKFAQKRCPFNHMTVAYKKDIILQLGGYKHHLFMEDYNLWLRIIGHGYNVANLSDVVLYARVGNGMHARRKGLQYIKSEKQLLDLKKQLQLQNPIYANIIFLIRLSFRLMPSGLLRKIYNRFLRKKVTK